MKKQLIIHPNIRAKRTEVIEDPVVVRVTEFTETGAKDFAKEMDKAENTGQTFIPIYIDSYGGECYSLLDMISTMQRSALPIYTVTGGKGMSCGAMLFAMGAKRFMSQNATIMLHEVSSGAWGKVEETKARIAQTDYLNNLLFAMIAKNCGHPENYFKDLIHNKSHADWYLNATECKEHNICTNIGIPTMSVEVSVNYSLIE